MVAAVAGDDEAAAAAKMEMEGVDEAAKKAVPLLPAAATRLTRRLERIMIKLVFDLYCTGVPEVEEWISVGLRIHQTSSSSRFWIWIWIWIFIWLDEVDGSGRWRAGREDSALSIFSIEALDC